MSERSGRADGEQPDLLDISMKTLCRHFPEALVRLAGLEVSREALRLTDISVALPEFEADQVVLVDRQGGGAEWGVHFEYQTQPDRRELNNWLLKNAALNRNLGIPVFLVAIYLVKGHRATFPNRVRDEKGPLVNDRVFNAIRLWEHADRIRGGELEELAPLLLLSEDAPSVETLQEELEMIRGLDTPPDARTDLLAVAYMIGTRYFLREVLNALFREELPMLKNAGIISDWLEEAAEQAAAKAAAKASAEVARRFALRLLRSRFGELPAALVERINAAEPEWCEDLTERAMKVETLQELGEL